MIKRSGSPQRLRWAIAAFGAAILALFTVDSIIDLRNDRVQIVDRAEMDARILSRTLEEHALGTIRTADLAIRSIQELIGREFSSDNLDEGRLAEIVRDHAEDIRPLARILIIDSTGRLRLNSELVEVPDLMVADREYFIHHRDSTSADFYIGQAVKGRVSGEIIVTISRRLNHADGSFAGVIVGSIPSYLFNHYYDELLGSSGWQLTLLHTDGDILARQPDPINSVGTSRGTTALFTVQLPQADSGVYWMTSETDGKSRMVSYRKIRGFPLVVTVATTEDVILQKWNVSVRQRILLCSVLAALMLLVIGYIWREIGLSRRYREQLAMSEQRFRDFAEVASDWLWETDTAGRFAYIYNTVGIDGDQLVGRKREEFFGAEGDPHEASRYRDDIEHRRPIENFVYQWSHPGRKTRFMQVNARPFFDEQGNYLGYRGTTTDITSEVELTRAISRREHQQNMLAMLGQRALDDTHNDDLFDRIVDVIPHSIDADLSEILVLEPDGEKLLLKAGFGWNAGAVGNTRISTGLQSQAGYTLLSKVPVISEDLATETRFTPSRRLLAHGAKSAVTVVIEGSNAPFGVLGAASTRGATLSTEDLNFLQALAYILSSVVIRRAEEQALQQLADKNAQLAAAMDSLEYGAMISDMGHPDRPVVFVNHGFLKMTGYAREEVLGRNPSFLQGDNTDPAAVNLIGETIRNSRSATIELLNYRKDGSAFWNQLSLSPIFDNGVKPRFFVGVCTDVTQRRETEEKLRQANKMEAVGNLTGGIAHDFNNLLTVILGNLEIAHDHVDTLENPELREAIDRASRGGETAAELVKRLLLFSRRQRLDPKVADVNVIINETSKLIRRSIEETIEIVISTAEEECPARVDRIQLENAIDNLTVNARDAMPNGGRLHIKTSSVVLDEKYGERYPYAIPGEYVLIAVSDTGCGMPPDVIARVFEPFYTTKAPGKGTGLGLSMVYGFVKESGGHVNIYSEVGVGTTIKLYFPFAKPQATQQTLEKPPITTGNETVLVVEDSPDLLKTAEIMIGNLGYTVLTASDGVEALALLAERAGAGIDLVLTDMIMPGGVTGADIISTVHQKYPHIRCIVASGYADAADRVNIEIAEKTAWIDKPYNIEALARMFRKVLDQPQNGPSDISSNKSPKM